MSTAPISMAVHLAAATAHAGPPWGHGPAPFAPVFGVLMCLVLLLLLAGGLFFLLRRRGGRPPWARFDREPPEEVARKVLAERFARGDITVEEFMERASALNWTPGSGPGGRG